jgi:tetratricopeptide (TPR) repeat protein
MKLLKTVLNLSAKRHFKTASELFIYHSNYEGALESIQKALEYEPDNQRAIVLYADVLFCLQREMEGLAVLDNVIANGAIAEAYISRASILEAVGKTREALADCDDALSRIQTSKHYLYASIYEQKISLLITLKHFRATESVLRDAAEHLDLDDYDYLVMMSQNKLRQARQKQMQQRQAVGASMSVISSRPLQLVKM